MSPRMELTTLDHADGQHGPVEHPWRLCMRHVASIDRCNGHPDRCKWASACMLVRDTDHGCNNVRNHHISFNECGKCRQTLKSICCCIFFFLLQNSHQSLAYTRDSITEGISNLMTTSLILTNLPAYIYESTWHHITFRSYFCLPNLCLTHSGHLVSWLPTSSSMMPLQEASKTTQTMSNTLACNWLHPMEARLPCLDEHSCNW